MPEDAPTLCATGNRKGGDYKGFATVGSHFVFMGLCHIAMLENMGSLLSYLKMASKVYIND